MTSVRTERDLEAARVACRHLAALAAWPQIPGVTGGEDGWARFLRTADADQLYDVSLAVGDYLRHERGAR